MFSDLPATDSCSGGAAPLNARAILIEPLQTKLLIILGAQSISRPKLRRLHRCDDRFT